MQNPLKSRAWPGAILALIATTVIYAGEQAQPPAGAPASPPAAAPAQPPAGAPAQPAGRRGAPPGGMLGGAGPQDKPPVDTASADRGKVVWGAECINCHGTMARGTDTGPNIVRSLLVLRDRYGTQLGPFLKKGHPMQSGKPSAGVTDAQITDLANFLRQRVNDSLRGSPLFVVRNVLTGDAKAGADYFNGAGRCSTCHTGTTSSLSGIGARYEPVDLQQRFLFPGGGRGRGARGGGPPATTAIIVAVTPPGGETASGVLIAMDDFNVSLRDASGAYRTFKRTAAVKVVKTDPLEPHHALLDTITDKNMHDVVAYLESLK
ncbi:MAG: cytochrome c [Acidobacteriota bacterium]